MEKLIQVTASELVAAFTEWDRRYRADPDKFMSEAQHLLKETPKTYGEACAPYFMAILDSQREVQAVAADDQDFDMRGSQ